MANCCQLIRVSKLILKNNFFMFVKQLSMGTRHNMAEDGWDFVHLDIGMLFSFKRGDSKLLIKTGRQLNQK